MSPGSAGTALGERVERDKVPGTRKGPAPGRHDARGGDSWGAGAGPQQGTTDQPPTVGVEVVTSFVVARVPR